MAFDKAAEANELESKIELVFRSGKERGLWREPTAYIAMGTHSRDRKGRPKLTSKATSFKALKVEVEYIKATLDARLAEAKARFAAAR